MDGPGFHVDIDVLEQAARAMGEVTQKQNGFSLDDLPGPPSMYGNQRIADAFQSFCSAYDTSTGVLVDKCEDLADGLTAAARAYREAEHTNAKNLTTDPALNAVEGH